MSRLKTGITEFDEMLHGGFLEGDAVMLAGSAGSGKTTLALQYLVNGATKYGENGVYVTFEQLPDQIYRDAEGFGWDLRGLEKEGKFQIICTSPDLLVNKNGAEELLGDTIRDLRPRRMVVDSLSHLQMFVPENDVRKEAYRLVMFLKAKGISSMLLWENPQIIGSSYSISDVGLSFMVDAIVALRAVEIESSMRRALGILKMRGSDHDKHLREYEITSHGIRVDQPFTQYEGLMSGSPRKVASEKFVDMFRSVSEKKKNAVS
jgi:circadian clock protein KaiC